MPDGTLDKSLNKIVDTKYASASDEIRDHLKERMKDIVSKMEAQGIDVTLQIYDKNAESQAQVQRMNREPTFA